MVNNHDWLGQLGYIELLQQVGTHFTINRMLTFDSVRLRLEREQPMTFLEFNYMILQGYDFRHLSKTMGVRLQMGGSDQWGNIINGMELARRMDGAEVFGLTTPLITKADGSKMGKSVSGAIWLNREQLPDYDYWQFWRNTDDRDVGRFLRLFTDISLDEIARLESLDGSDINTAKIALANAATELCRGSDAAILAAETARKTFEEGASGGDLPSFDASGEISVIDALVALNFVTSKKEARRMIQGGGARVEGDAVTDEDAVIATQAGPVKISAGKKKHGLINFE
jgi:tyrosyl-tRNA synthetase